MYSHVDTYTRRLRVRAFLYASQKLLLLWEKRHSGDDKMVLKRPAAAAAIVVASRMRKRCPEIPIKLAACLLRLHENSITNYVKALRKVMHDFGLVYKGGAERGSSACFRWAAFLNTFGDDLFAADSEALPLLKTLARITRRHEKQLASSPDAVAAVLLSLTSYLRRGRDVHEKAMGHVSTFATCRNTTKTMLAIDSFAKNLRRVAPAECAARCDELFRVGYVPSQRKLSHASSSLSTTRGM